MGAQVMAATHARALRSSPAAIYLACARSANAGRRCPPRARRAWSTRRVLFGAEYPVQDPTTFAVIALIFICDKCAANFAESLGQERPKAPPTK